MAEKEQRRKEGYRGARFSFGWPVLLLGGVLLAVSNGRWIVPLGAWLAPVLLLRYLRRSEKLWKGLAALWLVVVISSFIAWLGLWPFPPLVMARIVAIGAGWTLVPYLLDRLSRQRIQGVTQTLIFPAAAVTVEFVRSLQSQSTWGNQAYTQTESLTLLQFASIAGIWGITFVMLWLAPVVNGVWEDGWRQAGGRRAAWTYMAALGIVMVYGSMRLIASEPAELSLRVATVSPPEIADLESEEGRQFLQEFQRIFMKQEVDPDSVARVRQRLDTIVGPLFAETRRQAQAGAELVVWPEASLISFDQGQDRDLIKQGQRLAREEGIYLGLTLAKVPVEIDELNENRLLLIDPAGEVLQTYWKHQTVPVVEEPFAVAGSDTVLAEGTPAGRLGGVICYDLDSPRYLRDAGRQKIDVLLAPTGDWPAIKDIHARMAIMRAVEQGFSLVRPANHGLTLAADYQGRVLAAMDHYATSERRMSAAVPRQGVRTLYTRIGDSFAWSCVLFSSLSVVYLLWHLVSSFVSTISSRRGKPHFSEETLGASQG